MCWSPYSSWKFTILVIHCNLRPLLPAERNWNIRIPGFASEEIRSLRKPIVPPTHQARVQAVNIARSSGGGAQSGSAFGYGGGGGGGGGAGGYGAATMGGMR